MAGASAAVELNVLIKIIQDQQASFKSVMNDVTAMVNGIKAGTSGAGASLDAFNRFFADTATSAKKAGEAGNDIGKKYKDGAKEGEKATIDLSKALQQLTYYARLAAGGFLAFQSVRFLKDIADTAARAQVLSTVLHVVGNNAGYSTANLDKLDRSVQALGITAQASRQALTQLIQAGLDPALAAGPKGLARAAQDLAVIGGINSSEAFSRLIYAIQRTDTLMLRTLGLMVSNEQAQQRYATSIGKTVGQLGQQDKVQALANEVMQKTIELQGTYERSMGDVGKMLTSLPRLTENLKVAVGNQLLPAYKAIIEEVSSFLDQLTVVVETQAAAANSSEGLVSAIHELGGVISFVLIQLAKHADWVLRLVEIYVAWKAAIAVLNGAEYLAGLPKKLAAIIDGLRGFIEATRAGLVYMGLLTAATESQSVAVTHLSIAQKMASASGPIANASMEATTTAVTATTLAVSELSLAWTSLGVLLAVPIVGYVIQKVSQENEEFDKLDPLVRYNRIKGGVGKSALAGGGRTEQDTEDMLKALDDWRKDHPESTARDKEKSFLKSVRDTFYPRSEFETPSGQEFLKQAKEAELKAPFEKKRSEIEKEEAKVAELEAKRDAARKKRATSGQDDIAKDYYKKQSEEAEAELKTHQLRLARLQADYNATGQRVTESQRIGDDLVEAIGAQAEAQSKLTALAAKPHTDEERKAAEEEYAKTKKDTARLRSELAESSKIDYSTAAEREKAAADVERKGAETAARRLQQRLEEGERDLFGEISVTKGEGPVSKEASRKTGEFIDQINILGEAGDDTALRMDKLRQSVSSTQNSLKTTQDLKNYTDALDKFATKAKALGTFTPRDQGLINLAKFNAAQEVREFTNAPQSRRDALDKAQFATQQRAIKTELQNQLQVIQEFNQEREQIEKAAVDRGLLGQETYETNRIARQRTANEQELAIARQEVTSLQEERAKPFSRRDSGQRVKELDEQIRAASLKVQETRTKGEGAVTSEQLKQDEAERDRLKRAKQQQLDTAAYYGGLKEQEAAINNRYDDQIEKLGSMAGATEGVKDQQEALNAAREKDLYAARLADQNKHLQDQKQLQEARFSREEGRITLAKDRGELTTAQAMRANNDLIRKRQALNLEMIATEQKLYDERREKAVEAQISGQPFEEFQRQAEESYIRLSHLHEEAVKLATSIETYGKKLKEAFGQGLQDVLTEALMGGKNIQDAFKSFVDGMKKQVIQAYTKEIAEKFTTAIGNIGTKVDPKTGERTGGIFNIPFLGLGKKDTKNDGTVRAKPLYVEVTNPPKPAEIPAAPAQEAPKYNDAGELLPSRKNLVPTTGSLMPDLKSMNMPKPDDMANRVKAQFTELANTFKDMGKQLRFMFGGSGKSLVGLAEGGTVEGPGTGTSDSVIARVSAGEHIMPADKSRTWGPLLEGIRTGQFDSLVHGRYAYGGYVGEVHSIAIPHLIPRAYASGGVVVSDGGASTVTPASGGGGNMMVQLHPEAMNMTMREWLESEVARQQTRR